MNRSEKRQIERATQKNNKQKIKENAVYKQWFEELPLGKKLYIGRFIEQKTIENDNLVVSILDSCFMASLDDNLEIDVLDMKKIITESNYYIADYKKYLESKGNEGFNMIENEELKGKAKDKIKDYMSGKMQKAKALKLLKNEFNLPFTELSNLWIEVKEEQRINCVNPHTAKKFINEVAADKEEKEVCEKLAENMKKVFPQKEAEKVIAEKINIGKIEDLTTDNTGIKLNGLKVVNTIQEIQGKYGTYIKSSTGVRMGQKHYKDKLDVEEEINSLEGEYKARNIIIKEEIEKLNFELKEIEEKYTMESEKYAELENVFDI